MKKTLIVMALSAICLMVSSCVVAEPARPAAGCEWVPGHFGPYGGWHPGHCA